MSLYLFILFINTTAFFESTGQAHFYLSNIIAVRLCHLGSTKAVPAPAKDAPRCAATALAKVQTTQADPTIIIRKHKIKNAYFPRYAGLIPPSISSFFYQSGSL